MGESSVSFEVKVLLDLVVELEAIVELNLLTLGFKLTESLGLQTDLNVYLYLVIGVDFELVLHLDFAASLKIKTDLKLISAFEFESASFEFVLVLQFSVVTVSILRTPSPRVAMTLAGLVARIVGRIIVFSLVFVDAMLSTSFGSVVVVVDSVLVNVVALIVIIALDIALVVGRVGIVASIFVDISTHILVGAIAVTSDTAVASLLADIVSVLVGFAVVATIAATRTVATGTTERTSRLSSVAAIARSGTISTARGRDSSLSVSLVEGLEALTGLGKVNSSRVGLEMPLSISAVVANLSVELLDSCCSRFVREDLSTIGLLTITAMAVTVTAVRLSAI